MSTWQKIVHFIQYDLWRRTSSELKGGKRVKRVGFGVLKTLILVVRGFSSKQLNTAANALTYNLKGCSDGIYFFVATAKEGMVAKKVVIKR